MNSSTNETYMHPLFTGRLTDEQEAIVRNFVMGYNVHDLGSGQLGLAMKLVELGAHTVTAVDKEYSHRLFYSPHPSITLVGEYFEEYARHGHFIDVALVSWPEVYNQQGLELLLRYARTVIYLGTNFDGTACGSAEMFNHLVQREVLALVPHKWNSLIVYGQRVQGSRKLLPEEYAALHRDSAYFKFGEDLDL